MNTVDKYSHAIVRNKNENSRLYGRLNNIFTQLYSVMIRSYQKHFNMRIDALANVPDKPAKKPRSKQIVSGICDILPLEDISASFVCRSSMQDSKSLMTSRDRAANTLDSYTYSGPPLTGRTIALIDDIATTGSTLAACVDELLAHGAEEVICFVLAINQFACDFCIRDALEGFQKDNQLHFNATTLIPFFTRKQDTVDYDTAIARYRTLLAQGDTTFYNCYYAGISYYAKELYFEAHDLLEAARKYAPEHVDLLYYLGRACSKTSWKEKGINYMRDAIRLSFPTDSLVARLYAGLADCYKEAGEPQKQIETLMRKYKYSPEKHSLLYRAAYVSYFRLRDFEATEKYLKAYIKTRPEGSRNLPQEVAEDGTVIINENNRYNAAERWLEDLQKRKKVEDFFKGRTKDGVDTLLIAP